MRTLDHDLDLRDRVASSFHLRRFYESEGYVFPGYPRPEEPCPDARFARLREMARLSPANRAAAVEALRAERAKAAREARAAWEQEQRELA